MVESRAKLLTAYQNAAYAADYRAFLDEITGVLKSRGVADGEPFMTEVAKGLAKLMAYKDEYEVGRLYSDPAFLEGLRDQFSGNPKLKINLGSPLISWRKDAKTGRPQKVAIPGWLALPMFRLLAKLKGLRGTAFDPLGWQADRRLERALIGEYRDLVREVAAKVTPANLHTAIELVAAADLIAGYGPVKEAGVEAYRARVAELLPKLAETKGADTAEQPVPA